MDVSKVWQNKISKNFYYVPYKNKNTREEDNHYRIKENYRGENPSGLTRSEECDENFSDKYVDLPPGFTTVGNMDVLSINLIR